VGEVEVLGKDVEDEVRDEAQTLRMTRQTEGREESLRHHPQKQGRAADVS
jgi:hypothetical protein